MQALTSGRLDRLFESSERHWSLFLLLVALTGHAYSIAVTGAKFWIDSVVYFELALSLFDADLLAKLYQGQFGLLYAHTPPGLPLLIRALAALFGDRLWLALATLQGLLSAVAVTWFVLAFRTRLGRRSQLAAIILCSLHPYFMAFHAAALTESISTSLMLLTLGVAIRALDGALLLRTSLGWLLALSMLAAQFRPYLGLVGILAAAAVIFRQANTRRIALYAATALAFAAGTLAFPAYRAAIGLGFFLPNVDALLLTHTTYIAWDLDEETAQSLKTVVLNDEIRTRLIGHAPIDYTDTWHIYDDLLKSGLSPADARHRIAAAAWRLRTSSFGAIERQLQLPLASMGFQLAPACCWPAREVARGVTASSLFNHIRYYYRWNSGWDRGSYLELFDDFGKRTRASQIYSEAAENFYTASIRPYVTDRLRPLRDPLQMRFLVSDPLIIAAWIGMFLLFGAGQRLTLAVVMAPFAIIYAVAAYTHIFGDNRHAHPLIPIIVVGFVKIAEEFFVRRYWARLRAWKIFPRSRTGPA